MNTNLALTLQHLCGHAKFHGKLAFCGLCKNQKMMSREQPLAPEIYLFYAQHKKYRFSVKRQYYHIECQDVLGDIFSPIFLTY